MPHSTLFTRVSARFLIVLVFVQVVLGANGYFLYLSQPILYGAFAGVPALILVGFYWNVGTSPISSRIKLWGWILSVAYHAGMAWLFIDQTPYAKVSFLSGGASLLSAVLAMIRDRMPKERPPIERVPRTHEERLMELRGVAGLILLWGMLGLALDVPLWIHGHQPGPGILSSNFSTTEYSGPLGLSDFGILAFAGLWMHWSVARKFSIFLSWYLLIGAVFVLSQLFPTGHFTITPNFEIVDSVPANVLCLFVIPFMVAQIWQLRVLKRDDIIELFQKRVKSPMAPVKAEGEDSPVRTEGAC